MKTRTRLLSILLAMSMLLTLLPISSTAKEPAAGSPFEDVTAADWYYEAVCYVKEQGLMQGTDAAHFSPDMVLTRGMIVTILYRMDGAAAASGAPFPDVTESAYYAVPIAWAAEKGIVSGYPDGRFGPDDPITRQQLVTILHRYVTYRGVSCPDDGRLDGFSDTEQIAEYALPALRWAVGAGLISGTSETTLSPLGGASRAQAAIILMRLAELLDEPEPPVKEPGGSDGGSGGGGDEPEPEEPKPEAPEDVLSKDGYIYAIASLTAEDRAVAAEVSTQEACTLTITILDQNTQKSVSVSTDAAAQLEMTELSISLTDALPEYFIVQAALTDDAGNLLCDPYVSMRYTKEQERFDSLTVEDFPEEIVVNFDNDPTDNFGVLADGAVELGADDGTAVVKDNGTVEIANASGEIRSMAAGDVLYIPSAEAPDDALVKVGRIWTEGDTVCIVPEEDVYLSDLYQVLKVDMSFGEEALKEALNAEAPAPAPVAAALDFAPLADDTDTEYKFKFDSNEWIGSDVKTPARIRLEGALMTAVKIEYDVELFGPDYIYQEIMTEVAATGMAGMSAGASSSDFPFTSVDFMDARVPVNIPGAAVYIKVGAAFDFECEASIDAVSKLSFKAGFIHDGNGNVQTIHEKSISFDPKLTGNGKVELSVGPSAELGLRFCEDILNVGINAGVSLHAEVKNDATAGQAAAGADDVHGCTVCFNGRMGPKLSLNLTGKYELSEKRRGQFLNVESAALFGDGDFFYSGGGDTDGVYGGLPHFGMGACKNHKYKVDFTVQDPDGEPLSDVSVTVKKGSLISASVKAPGSAYFYNGAYLAEADINGKTTQEPFAVADGPQRVTLSAKNPSIRGRVTERAEDGTEQALSGVSIVFRKGGADGEIVRTLTTASSGSYQVTELRQGTYHITFSKDDYETQTLQIDLKNDSQIDVVLTKVSNGVVSGTIIDAVSRAPLPSVSVTASQDDRVIASAQSDQEGFYTMSLPAGNYQLSFSRMGYDGKTVSTVIVSGQTVRLDQELDPAAGGLSVTVTDGGNDDAPIAGALVEIKKDGTAVSSGTTDENGVSAFTDLPAGSYELLVSKEGYAPYSAKDITISGDSPAERLARLHRGGNCGPTLYWKLENGTLTIYGEGEMDSSPSFSQFASEIRRVVVEPGATSIGSSAFYDFQNLASVTLPDTIEKIGRDAFAYCPALTSVRIPDSVTLIDEFAFDSCENLSQLSLGQGVETIGLDAFLDCSSLTAVDLPASVRTIGDKAFAYCSALARVDLKEGLRTISTGAFGYCSALTSVHIPSSVTTMGGGIFAGCENLRDVTLPPISEIQSSMFSGCKALTSITIPEGVTEIHTYAFEGTGITQLVIPDSVTKIHDKAFTDAALTSITFSDSSELREIGFRAFEWCTGLSGTITLPSKVTTVGAYAFAGAKISDVEMKGPVSSIGSCAFGDSTIPTPILARITYGGTSKELAQAVETGGMLYREWKNVTVYCTDGIFSVSQAEGLIPKT